MLPHKLLLAWTSTILLVSRVLGQSSYPAYPKVTESPFNLANLTDFAQPNSTSDFTTTGPFLELVHELYEDLPTGVAVDKNNRIFVNYPRSQVNASKTVGLVTNFTAEVAWPNVAIQNCQPGQNVSTCFVNVQSVVIDSTQERIWILDTGIPPGAKTALKYGAKIWGFNLTTNETIRNYVLPYSISANGTNINDIRFNLSLSTEGVGFLSEEQGSLLTLDLGSGVFRRQLFNTSVAVADVGFVGTFDGEPFWSWNGTKRSHLTIGADGIALASGNVYFGPLASRRVYQVPQIVLANASLTDPEILAQVEYLGQAGSYTEGYTADDQGRVYVSTAEQNSISYFNTSLSSLTSGNTLNGLKAGMNGVIPASDITIEPFARSALIQWADSMCIENGYLWFTANQLPLSAQYRRNGVSMVEKPYKIYRAYIGAGPAV